MIEHFGRKIVDGHEIIGERIGEVYEIYVIKDGRNRTVQNETTAYLPNENFIQRQSRKIQSRAEIGRKGFSEIR
jgi:hypothetical protein